MRLLLLISLWTVSCASYALAEHVVVPVNCVRADGRLFLEQSQPTSMEVVGNAAQRPYTICAPNNGRYCRTLEIHKFDVMCAGQRIAWRDVAATIIRQRGAEAAVLDGRLSFKLARKSFISLNGLCDESERASTERKSIHCIDKGYVPRITIELPSGFAPLAELGGRIVERAPLASAVAATRAPVFTESASRLSSAEGRGRIPLAGNDSGATNVKPVRLAAVGKTTMALPAEGNATEQQDRTDPEQASNSDSSLTKTAAVKKIQPVRPTAAARPTDQVVGTQQPGPQQNVLKQIAPANARALTNGVQIASAGKTGVATTNAASWSASVSEAVRTNISAVTKSGPQMQQSLVATVIGLALITSLISGIGWFATQQILSLRSRTSDPYQLILRREVVDLAKPDAQMCGELCRTGQGLIGDIKGAAPLRRVLIREVRAMEQFLATTIQTAPDDPREWRRMRLRLQRVVTDLIRLKDITDGARRSLTSRVISDDLPHDKQEAFEVLGANPEASQKILKRLVDALRATWHPDLAANDDDRELRDRRIKQINVAWDLISEKRSEA